MLRPADTPFGSVLGARIDSNDPNDPNARPKAQNDPNDPNDGERSERLERPNDPNDHDPERIRRLVGAVGACDCGFHPRWTTSKSPAVNEWNAGFSTSLFQRVS